MKLFMRFTELKITKKIKTAIFILTVFLGVNSCFAFDAWANNLKTMFQNNSAVIYALNLRSFGAKDYNKNDIIELELGEVKGTFLNAIPKLETIRANGFNTIYLLPITKTGKLKALGTAGSLYALDSFDTLNPQLLDETDFNKDIKKQAQKFVEKAHSLGLHVIVDLPSCGSYDFSLSRPELFEKDRNNEAVTPADWTDVRLFKVYNDDKTLNKDLILEHKKFIDLMQYIGVDGVRADVAAIKPGEFWKIVIDYARQKDPDFMFLAEASTKWENPAKGFRYASVEELLEAGFDGFYSDWSDLADIKNASEINDKISEYTKVLEKFGNKKSVIANFATHDQQSPALLGYPFWQAVNWLNMTLPLNPYVLDGFPCADNYIYKYQNKKADKTYTDNDTYYVHKGQLDIFNFSRAPYDMKSERFVEDFEDAMRFRYMMTPLITSKSIETLRTTSSNVFAFKRQNGNDTIVVIGNLKKDDIEKAKVSIPKFKKEDFVLPFKMKDAPTASNGALEVSLKPYEIQIFAIRKASNK